MVGAPVVVRPASTGSRPVNRWLLAAGCVGLAAIVAVLVTADRKTQEDNRVVPGTTIPLGVIGGATECKDYLSKSDEVREEAAIRLSSAYNAKHGGDPLWRLALDYFCTDRKPNWKLEELFTYKGRKLSPDVECHALGGTYDEQVDLVEFVMGRGNVSTKPDDLNFVSGRCTMRSPKRTSLRDLIREQGI